MPLIVDPSPSHDPQDAFSIELYRLVTKASYEIPDRLVAEQLRHAAAMIEERYLSSSQGNPRQMTERESAEMVAKAAAKFDPRHPGVFGYCPDPLVTTAKQQD